MTPQNQSACKKLTAFSAVQFRFETTMMQLTLPDYTRQQQGRACVGTKPQLSHHENGTLSQCHYSNGIW